MIESMLQKAERPAKATGTKAKRPAECPADSPAASFSRSKIRKMAESSQQVSSRSEAAYNHPRPDPEAERNEKKAAAAKSAASRAQATEAWQRARGLEPEDLTFQDYDEVATIEIARELKIFG